MTIGLILLAAIAIFLFFGGTDKFFAKLGLPSKLAFIIVLALVFGTVIPQIRFGNAFTVNMGGFLIPLAVMAVFFLRCDGNGERVKALLAVLSVAAVCVAVRMLIPNSGKGLTVTISVVSGFVGAAIACMIAPSRVSAIAGVLGGVVFGDVFTSLVYRFFIDGSFVELGTAGAFDAVIIGVIFAVIIGEFLSAINNRTHSSKQLTDNISFVTTQTETANDFAADEEKPPIYHFNEEDYEEYFNDDID